MNVVPVTIGALAPTNDTFDVLHLALARASRRLQHAFDDVPQAVDAPGAQAAAEGVERQLAVELDAAVLDEVERFAFLAEAVGLEAVDAPTPRSRRRSARRRRPSG